MDSSFANCYRDLILNGEFPLIIHEPLNWECLTWNLLDWVNIFRDKLLRFRCGRRQCQKFPVWEGQCSTISTTFEDFIQFCSDEKSTPNEWRYFDYKHMVDCFDTLENSFKFLTWESVGFPEKGAESSTVWIGSSGAHTPCHVDTYGCNVVVQVYGRKRWILFPFSEITNLQPTRVPYEESSIYSNINFACPKNLSNVNFDDCYAVDLNPGDILFVPPKWWHYVQNLTTAISINTWIPHPDDDSWRLKEGLVRYFMSSVVNNVSMDMKKEILNPNETCIEESSKMLRILDFCREKEKCVSVRETSDISFEDNDEQDDNRAHNHKYSFIPRMNDLKMKNIEEHKSDCTFSETDSDDLLVDGEMKNLMAVINAFCHPDVINEIQNKFKYS